MRRSNRNVNTQRKITIDEIVVDVLKLLPRSYEPPNFKSLTCFGVDYKIGKVKRPIPSVRKTK